MITKDKKYMIVLMVILLVLIGLLAIGSQALPPHTCERHLERGHWRVQVLDHMTTEEYKEHCR